MELCCRIYRSCVPVGVSDGRLMGECRVHLSAPVHTQTENKQVTVRFENLPKSQEQKKCLFSKI